MLDGLVEVVGKKEGRKARRKGKQLEMLKSSERSCRKV
jgi:hypothetical protein